MAQINEMLTFELSLYDINGDPSDTTVIESLVEEPDGVTHLVTFTKKVTGVYTGTFVCKKAGDHWIRVETSGGIQTAIEKKFNVAEQKVVI